MQLRSEGEVPKPDSCTNKARTFIGGTLFSRADLDLNVYHVLTLNDDPTITVVDPLFGFGSTKLLALIPLESRGYDWALSERLRRLFVSMPAARKVAIVDTDGWQVAGSIATRIRPGLCRCNPTSTSLDRDRRGRRRIGGHRREHPNGEDSGPVPTGRGKHAVAFSSDSRYTFVTNAIDGTVSIIDVGRLKKMSDVRTGTTPSAVAFSDLAQMAYVTHEGDGSVVAVEAGSGRIVARMQTRPGVTFIRFAPGGRFGFTVNPATDELRILDATSNRIIQGATMLDGPDQVAFSDELAYVRHRGDERVLMVPLDDIGVEGRQIQVIDFPGGQSPPGRMSNITPAAGIVQAPGAAAVLGRTRATSPVDFYKEGMAPMGNFSNYGRTPRAVLVLDRSLRQRSAPGVYETFAQLRKPGLYDVVFFLDAPRTVQCFEVMVEQDPVLQRQRATERLPHVEGIVPERTVRVGQPARVAFRVTDAASGVPRTGLSDVEIMVDDVAWRLAHAGQRIPGRPRGLRLRIHSSGCRRLCRVDAKPFRRD